MSEKKAAYLALILVILMPVLLLTKAVYDRETGVVWQVDIAGYDPRDLLRGHYLQFRYDWALKNDGNVCAPEENCCLCLTEKSPGDRTNPEARVRVCRDRTAIKECTSLVRGKKRWDEILAGGQVYFIPQSHARQLESALLTEGHDFKMEISVRRGGGPPVIRRLLIDGRSVPDFVRENPAE
jgi:uncharacterized membrane-anchored protein